MNDDSRDLSDEELAAYDELLDSLASLGRAGRADTRTVAAAARAIVLADRLREEVDALSSLSLGEQGRPAPRAIAIGDRRGTRAPRQPATHTEVPRWDEYDGGDGGQGTGGVSRRLRGGDDDAEIGSEDLGGPPPETA